MPFKLLLSIHTKEKALTWRHRLLISCTSSNTMNCTKSKHFIICKAHKTCILHLFQWSLSPQHFFMYEGPKFLQSCLCISIFAQHKPPYCGWAAKMDYQTEGKEKLNPRHNFKIKINFLMQVRYFTTAKFLQKFSASGWFSGVTPYM